MLLALVEELNSCGKKNFKTFLMKVRTIGLRQGVVSVCHMKMYCYQLLIREVTNFYLAYYY